MKILEKELDKENNQVGCASWLEGPLMVLAGPGAGKTRVLTHRIGYILRKYPKEEFRILALTYTNKAANEMNDRLKNIPGYINTRVWTGTFHGFCIHLLRNYSCYIGIPRNFSIIEDIDQVELLKNIKLSNGLPPIDYYEVINHISKAKSRLQTFEEYAENINENKRYVILDYAKEYQKRLLESNSLDYDDIISLTIKMFDQLEPLCKIINDTYKFTLIDECQDTTYAQHELIKKIVPKVKPNLFIVADENQNIFEWNNARLENLSDIINNYNMQILNLNCCYRCPDDIVKLANKMILKVNSRIIERNGELTSIKKDKTNSVSIYPNDNEEIEASSILEFINTMISKGYKYGDIAILCKNGFIFDDYEKMFNENNIRYIKYGSNSNLKSIHITIYTSALKFINNKSDVESFGIIVNRIHFDKQKEFLRAKKFSFDKKVTIGKALEELSTSDKNTDTLLKLYKELDSVKHSDEIINILNNIKKIYELFGSEILNDDGMIVAIETPSILWKIAEKLKLDTEDRSLSSFLTKIALEKKGDLIRSNEYDGNYIHLLTVHASKGTEYPIVIIIALEDGIFPHWKSKDISRIDEERRSFFVAMTRAKEYLILSYAKSRKTKDGYRNKRKPSIFLMEIAQEIGIELK